VQATEKEEPVEDWGFKYYELDRNGVPQIKD
jgi:serine protease inhibitor ecotin